MGQIAVMCDTHQSYSLSSKVMTQDRGVGRVSEKTEELTWTVRRFLQMILRGTVSGMKVEALFERRSYTSIQVLRARFELNVMRIVIRMVCVEKKNVAISVHDQMVVKISRRVVIYVQGETLTQ